jgi:UDP-3-O-[3-hydroxymyristoyl] glucosamine N-acyltransferase
MRMRVHDLAGRLDGQLEGDPDLEITGVATLDTAAASQVTFVASDRLMARAKASAAGCLLVSRDFAPLPGRCLIRVADARAAFASVVAWFRPRQRPAAGIHPTAVVDPSVEVGARTRIGAYCVVGPGTRIGADCVLHAHVTLYDGVTLGDRVVLHAGVVVGADGFGYVPVGDRFEPFPQVGGVEIGDDVEIGANSAVDRGALESTRIGRGTKIDNLVHVAHNCQIGNHVLIAAQSGLAGGAVVGDRVVIGGQVGVGDKARIDSGAVLGAGAGVFSSKHVRAGEPQWGMPARPLRQYLRRLADTGRIGELREEVAALKRRLEEQSRPVGR